MDVVEQAIRKLTEIKLRDIAEYCTELERKFLDDIESVSTRFGASELDQELVDVIVDERQKIEDVLLQAFRSSMIVILCSFLEERMNSLCHHLKKKKKIRAKLEDNKNDKGIERARVYLCHECSITFPDNTNEWNEIAKMSKLRNHIVHPSGDPKYKSTFRSMKGIQLNDGRVTIQEEYIPVILRKAQVFMDKLYDEAFRHDVASPR